MSEIKIDDLSNSRPQGAEFFTEEEGYLENLSEDELNVLGGGLNLVVSVDNRDGFISVDDGRVVPLPGRIISWTWKQSYF